MNKQTIIEQLESMESAFDTLKDNVHWILVELKENSIPDCSCKKRYGYNCDECKGEEPSDSKK